MARKKAPGGRPRHLESRRLGSRRQGANRASTERGKGSGHFSARGGESINDTMIMTRPPVMRRNLTIMSHSCVNLRFDSMIESLGR
jgi:hypothetical protein